MLHTSWAFMVRILSGWTAASARSARAPEVLEEVAVLVLEAGEGPRQLRALQGVERRHQPLVAEAGDGGEEEALVAVPQDGEGPEHLHELVGGEGAQDRRGEGLLHQKLSGLENVGEEQPVVHPAEVGEGEEGEGDEARGEEGRRGVEGRPQLPEGRPHRRRI